MSVFKLPGSAIQANTITTTQLLTTVVTQISAGGGPKVKSLIYPGNDSAANSTGGQTVYITGSGFAANAQVLVNGSAVPSQSFISASNISFTTPALSTGTYPVYIINPEDGGTAILYPGLLISGEPAWVTSAGSLSASQDELSSWSYSLSATGDTPITYALAAGSSLPGGVSLAANGLISGTISTPSGNDTTYTFTVVATDAQNQDSTRQFTVTTTTGEGLLFANNVLLIHADGTNNGNNHAFIDSSNNNFTITRGNNATQGSFSPFSQTGWSAYFDGSGDTLTVSSYTATNVGTGNFTFEVWIYPTSFADYNIIFDTRADATANPLTFGLDITTGYPYYYTGTTYAGNAGPALNRWSHIAFTRSGTTVNIWVNGVSVLSRTDSSNLTGTSTGTIRLGATIHNIAHFVGYISNFRVLKGTALYTSSFAPPTSPLTAVANTSLLTLQSNRFIDNSTNAFTITRNGDTSIQPFSPFAVSTVYSSANVGGSGYFDGTDDWLSISAGSAGNLSTGDFTVELWFYPTSNATQSLIQQGEHDWRINTSGSNLQWVTASGVRFTSSGTYTARAWNHVAVVKSGSTQTMYLNGVSQGTTTVNPANSNNPIAIGVNTASVGNVWYFGGYIANARVVKGTAVYTGAFTPPTAPLTNIANTSLLLNFTNAQIFDQTAKNVLETVGDAKVTTSQYKYGTGSIVFDGNGDGLFIPYNPNLTMRGNYTIEFWIRFTSLSGYQTIYSFGYGISGDIILQTGNGDGKIIVYTGNPSAAIASDTGSTVNTGQWYHIAVVRNGSTVTIYRDGISVGSGSDTVSHNPSTATTLMIGGGSATGFNNFYFNGYLDDLRITKGYARYTSNFTPPTSALKDK